MDVGDYTAIHPRRLDELDLQVRARALNHDFVARPWKDGFAMRLHFLQTMDPGNYHKGALGGWQVDSRDPTADVRLLEFCLAVPTDQFLHNGMLRSLARRALVSRWPTGTKTSQPSAMASWTSLVGLTLVQQLPVPSIWRGYAV